jgi:TonB family protein
MRQARLIKRVEPVYPPEAKVRRIEGVVTLSVIIGKDGSVKILQVLAGDPVLSPAAVDAVRRWLYEPLLSDGQPLEVQTTLDVTFSLNH